MLNKGILRNHSRELGKNNMEHKFIIEVRLITEPPRPAQCLPDPGAPAPQTVRVPVDPKQLQALLSQLPHVLAAVAGSQPNPKPTGQPPRPTGQPPRP